MKRLVTLAQDERGASLVELALVVPIMASLLIGMIDLSRAYSYKLKLEQAAQRAIEKVQQYQASSSTPALLKAEAGTAARATGATDVQDSDVTVDFWLECDGTRAANYESVCAGGQTYGRWVSVTVTGTFTPLFRSKQYPGANANGTFTLNGSASMRTQ